MSFPRWLQHARSAQAPAESHRGRRAARRAVTHRPRLEFLEDRSVPAFLAPVDDATVLPPVTVKAGDFNGDSVLDLATANGLIAGQGEYTVSVLLGNVNGTFQPARNSTLGSIPNNLNLEVGDFNGDGFDDLVTANLADECEVTVLLSDGNGTFKAPNRIDVGPVQEASVAVGDFNGDGKLDLAVAGGAPNFYYYYSVQDEVNVLLGNGDGSFSGPINSVIDRFGFTHSAGVVGDFNGDGKEDLVVNGQDGALLLGDGRGGLVSQGLNPTLGGIAAADVNGDGKLDLLQADKVLRGDGAGGFTTLQTYDSSPTWAQTVLGDFNRDGSLDIAKADVESNIIRVFRGHRDGTFGEAEYLNFAHGDEGLAAADFNGDGWCDLATADFDGKVTSVLINDRSWPTLPPTVSISDATVTEGNTGDASATFTATLSRATNVDVAVHYATVDISAAAGSDYTSKSGTVVIPAGKTSATLTVAVTGDRVPEPDETFAVNLSGATNATIADEQAIGTILDNEPRITISDVTRAEGKKNKTTLFTFTVTLSVPYDQPVTVSFQTVNGTATTGDGDYVAKSGTLTFAPGETTKTITIVVQGDNKRESSEEFYLDLFDSSSNSLITKKRGIGTIVNDD
jgi:hypothetical protein